MTQQQKRIKLAEFEGWKQEYIYGNGVDADVWIRPTSGKCWLAEISVLPDYFGDLNAVHNLEEKLDALQLNLYENELAELCNLKVSKSMASAYRWHATAEQRSEVIGRTLNLW